MRVLSSGLSACGGEIRFDGWCGGDMFERKAKRKADCRANSRWSVSSCAWYLAWSVLVLVLVLGLGLGLGLGFG